MAESDVHVCHGAQQCHCREVRAVTVSVDLGGDGGCLNALEDGMPHPGASRGKGWRQGLGGEGPGRNGAPVSVQVDILQLVIQNLTL